MKPESEPPGDSDPGILSGGCLCGAVRYETSGMPFEAEYCHCRMCQKSTGSPAATWMDFRRDQVSWTGDEPAEYASSEHVRRGFCASCGSTLSFRDSRHPEYLTLTLASLDEPRRVRPGRHIHTASQLDWFVVDDACERFRHGPGDATGPG